MAEMFSEKAFAAFGSSWGKADYDTVLIRDLRTQCILGILPEERVTPQTVVFNAELYTDLTRALSCDDISETLNYARAAEIITATAASVRAGTAEYLAGRIIAALRQEFGERLQGILLEIQKPEILPDVSGVGVRVRRMFGGGND
ncbi:dihydroneopterin aldolase [Succinimonas amylolytica]|uniref:dihydroneopterin aldolase n=1 Tax=Succinimonas amylolytica TaxID=83769 RepID=UPI000374E90E|nr:dihydroneopterin aldolase [Succinimonas amylolytica]